MLPPLPGPQALLPGPRALLAGPQALLAGPQALLGVSLRLARSGLIRPYRPDRLPQVGWGLLRYGAGPGFGPLLGAQFCPDQPALVDDDGTLTFGELEARCRAVAAGLTASLAPGETIGLLARNSAGFYLTMVGAARCGLHVVYLNPSFSPGQIAQAVLERGVRALVHDADLAGKVPSGITGIPVSGGEVTSIGQLAVTLPPAAPAAPVLSRTRHTILTSGTTGHPKGVARSGGDLASVTALVSGLPYRARERWLVAVPMFHAWGWLHALLGMVYSSTIVLTREFDPERVLALAEREQCQVLVAVPTMLRRIMSLPPRIRQRYRTTALRAVTVSGAALPPHLAGEFMDEFGDILYSLYGSTEAGYAAVATPADLRAAPGTAGRPLPLVNVQVLDSQSAPAPPGRTGMIWVSSRDAIPTAGRAGAVSTGDLGWLDEAGRLFIAGRADDMIISGGENVYPGPVEAVLEQHPDVAEAVVTGKADPDFGQVLVAHVVARDNTTVTAASLRAWCRARLAPFQVPKQFVVASSLPRNAAGKVVKRDLPDPG